MIEAGGSAKGSKAETQEVTLTLTPVGAHDQDWHVADQVPAPPP